MRRRASVRPLVAALGLSLLGFLAVGLAGPRLATAADATPSPFVQGRHVYDSGSVLSAHSVTTAEGLASHIESAGGGRVVIYTVPESSSVPSTLAKDWSVDGLLLAVQYDFGQMTMGATLKGKLTSAQSKYIDRNATSGPTSTESWLMSTLARVERVRQRNKRLRRRRDSRCER